MSRKRFYTAPLTEVVRVDCAQTLLAGSGAEGDSQDDDSGGLSAKRNRDSWDLWEDEEATGGLNDMSEYHIKSVWDD